MLESHRQAAIVIGEDLGTVPIEDLLGLPEQPNLPGTIDEHPNWRQRLPMGGDRLFEDGGVRRRVAGLNALRAG